MFLEKKQPSAERKKEAAKFLLSLDRSKTYRLHKIATRESRRTSNFIGSSEPGRLSLISVNPASERPSADADDNFVLMISAPSGNSFVKTSVVLGCGKTEDDVILIETLNSVYRLEVAE